MATLQDVLDKLRDLDQGEITAKHPRNFGPAALLADETLAQLVCAWPNVPMHQFTHAQLRTEVPPETPAHLVLRWVFAQLEPDPIPVWIGMAGLPDAPHVRRATLIAIDHRLVMPQGALSTWAARYCEEALKNAIATAGKRRGSAG